MLDQLEQEHAEDGFDKPFFLKLMTGDGASKPENWERLVRDWKVCIDHQVLNKLKDFISLRQNNFETGLVRMMDQITRNMKMLMVFAVKLHWFPIGFSVPIGMDAGQISIADRIRHAILPAAALSIMGISSIALHTREKLIEVMESDYVLFARARGESDWSILRRHGLRNILLPAMTLQFASVSEIIGGSVLVEQVFSYPGLGQAAVTAGLGSDVPLLLGITVVTAVIVAAGNLAANVLYGVIDPRIREGAKR